MQPAKQYNGAYPWLILLLLATFTISICYGAVNISITEIVEAFNKTITGQGNLSLNERILMQIRLPRAILCMLTGSSLAVGGTLMQALFRNPIVEPGLIGTSSGAACGAAFYYALGGMLHFNAGTWALPIAAFAGGLLATSLVFLLSGGRQGRSSIVTILLTGMAVNALFISCVGFFAYIARDPQARSITFWNMGTMAGADWDAVIIVAITTASCLFIAMRYARKLNALIIGEQEAQLIGVHVKKLKRNILLINVIMVATATAFVGVISFVGLVIPHLLRIWKGADNRFLLPAGALAGAILLNAADIVARLALSPAELPIGIVTALVGVPVFIYLLRRKNYYF